MSQARFLIVNADDFGQTEGVTRGIIEAFTRGIVTSTSAMVRWPAIDEAARCSKEFPKLSVGLHLDVSEWAFQDEEWVCLYQVVDEKNAKALREEVSKQLEAFRSFFGKDPTHIDSHQHAHLSEPFRSIVLETADQLGAPVRHLGPLVTYCGSFYGQSSEGFANHDAITADSLIATLSQLPAGVTELACHPGYGDGLEGMYVHERSLELQTLCDPRVRQAIDQFGIHLVSFDNFVTTHRERPHDLLC